MARPALHALLAICVLTAGRSLLGPDHSVTRAVWSLDNSTDSLAATETYRFESDITFTASADGRTERVDVDLAGPVDVGLARCVRTPPATAGRGVHSC